MHAVFVEVTINDLGPAQEYLQGTVVPGVKQAPGFVAGYWTRNADGTNGRSLVVFESEEAAQGAADRLQQDGSGVDEVTLDTVEVREVVASA
jgi:hypothetical protein